MSFPLACGNIQEDRRAYFYTTGYTISRFCWNFKVTICSTAITLMQINNIEHIELFIKWIKGGGNEVWKMQNQHFDSVVLILVSLESKYKSILLHTIMTQWGMLSFKWTASNIYTICIHSLLFVLIKLMFCFIEQYEKSKNDDITALTVDFITYVVGAFQSILEGVFTLVERLLLIFESISCI